MVTDTIVAVSSPIGNSLKGIVRLSGSQAFSLMGKLAGKNIPNNSWSSYKLKLILPLKNTSTGIPLPVMLYLMPAPNSYTREDVVEIHTLGSKLLLDGLLQYFISKGACLARPGEFTKRAFTNGRISLSQSEAILNIIHSSTERQHQIAVTQLHRHSFRKLNVITGQLLDLVSQIELTLDFSDQDIEIITPNQIKTSLEHIIIEISKNIKASSEQAVNTDGVICILCGRPNTGKSSLFNRLVRGRRNIVSPISGTTLDYVEGKLIYKNTSFKIFDTAGISREKRHKGYPEATKGVPKADINLLVVDNPRGLIKQDQNILKRLHPAKTIVVMNKIDLVRRGSVFIIPGFRGFPCSALTGAGIPELKNGIINIVQTTPPERSSDQTLITMHQQEALTECLARLNKALTGVKNRIPYEFITLHLKDALARLNAVLDDFTSRKNFAAEDILDNIFSKFCIGK